MAYRVGLLRVEHVGVPVIVVGNLTVGGTGKTPVAAWLAHQLEARGRRVGVVLRGYGGSHRGGPRVVAATDDAVVTGDEALVHARRGVHTVVIGADRVAAARLQPCRVLRSSFVTTACNTSALRVTMKLPLSTAPAGSVTAGCCPPVHCASPPASWNRSTRSS